MAVVQQGRRTLPAGDMVALPSRFPLEPVSRCNLRMDATSDCKLITYSTSFLIPCSFLFFSDGPRLAHPAGVCSVSPVNSPGTRICAGAVFRGSGVSH